MSDKKLDEVRRTLQHLQRIASEPIEENDRTEPTSAASTSQKSGWGRVIGNFYTSAKLGFEQVAATIRPGGRRRTLVIGTVVIVAIGLVGLTNWYYIETEDQSFDEINPTTTAAIEPTEPQTMDAEPLVETAVYDAQQLISAGNIAEARRRLIDLDEKTPEAALTLARSYDPNYLRLIPNADAAANPGEAERWYREWRAIAADNGLALEEDRLDRIINAMH